MRTSQILTGLAAITAVSAAAVAKTHQDYNVYFEHETGTPLIPEYTAIGDYNSLNWGPFTLATSVGSSQGNIGGVIPSNGTKSAAYPGIDYVFGSNSSITPAGRTTYFALHGFHFGCTLNDLTTVAGLNTGCTINVRGMLKGSVVGTATFEYKPENPVAAEMLHVLLPKTFADVDTVSFSLAKGGFEAYQVLLLDNIYYTVYF